MVAFQAMRDFLGPHDIDHFNMFGHFPKINLLADVMPATAFASGLVVGDDSSQEPQISPGKCLVSSPLLSPF